jgi:hypothetical protein
MKHPYPLYQISGSKEHLYEIEKNLINLNHVIEIGQVCEMDFTWRPNIRQFKVENFFRKIFRKPLLKPKKVGVERPNFYVKIGDQWKRYRFSSNTHAHRARRRLIEAIAENQKLQSYNSQEQHDVPLIK